MPDRWSSCYKHACWHLYQRRLHRRHLERLMLPDGGCGCRAALARPAQARTLINALMGRNPVTLAIIWPGLMVAPSVSRTSCTMPTTAWIRLQEQPWMAPCTVL
jgi:hypothetical protein